MKVKAVAVAKVAAVVDVARVTAADGQAVRMEIHQEVEDRMPLVAVSD